MLNFCELAQALYQCLLGKLQPSSSHFFSTANSQKKIILVAREGGWKGKQSLSPLYLHVPKFSWLTTKNRLKNWVRHIKQICSWTFEEMKILLKCSCKVRSFMTLDIKSPNLCILAHQTNSQWSTQLISNLSGLRSGSRFQFSYHWQILRLEVKKERYSSPSLLVPKFQPGEADRKKAQIRKRTWKPL